MTKWKKRKFKRKILKVNEEILYFMMKSFFCLIQLLENWAGHHNQTDTVNVLKDRKNMKRSRLIGENLDGTSNIGPDMQQTHEPWPSRYP